MNCHRYVISLLFGSLVCLPMASTAGIINGSLTTIKRIITFPEFGDGDFLFQTEETLTGCEGGFYLKQSDPGFKSTVATILSAQALKQTIQAFGDDSNIWSGSSSKYCKLYTIKVSS